MALLGHELGHLVNGDPDQGFLTQPALRTFGQLAYFFHPGALPGARLGLGVAVRVLMTPFWFVFASLQLRLRKIASGDHVRAEIHADVCGVRLAGTDGATELATTLVLGDEITTEIRRAARRDGTPATLLAAAESVRTRPEDSLRVFEQVSIREQASLFATHPPAGLRVRLVRGWPWQDPSFVLDARRSTAIDVELGDGYRETLRALSLAR